MGPLVSDNTFTWASHIVTCQGELIVPAEESDIVYKYELPDAAGIAFPQVLHDVSKVFNVMRI